MYALPSFIYVSTPSASKRWHASLGRTSPRHVPWAALLSLPGCSKPLVFLSGPAVLVVALARLHCVPEQGADPRENPAFTSFSTGLLFRVALWSCSHVSYDASTKEMMGIGHQGRCMSCLQQIIKCHLCVFLLL